MRVILSLGLVVSSVLTSRQTSFQSKRVSLSLILEDVQELVNKSQTSNLVWNRLAEMTDLFGPRLPGSQGLQQSLRWIQNKAIVEDNMTAYIQPVYADVWVRNRESLYFLSPTRGRVKLDFLGLGKSIGTVERGIVGEVVSVRSWDQHRQLGLLNKLKGKVVLCNPSWEGYAVASDFRMNCARKSERYGAVAVLVRSATPFSLNTPHTGTMNPSKIPGAAITLEDAEMLHRIQTRSQNIISTPEQRYLFQPPKVHLTMGAITKRNQSIGGNLILELKGKESPEQIVILSGHIDSWDVGYGVLDDGAGAFVAWEVLRQIQSLNKSLKRTLRVVFWNDEEQGSSGGKVYLKANQNNLEQHVLAMESDSGILEPNGFLFQGTDAAYEVVKQVGTQLLGNTTFGNVKRTTGSDADISFLCKKGVPCISLSASNRKDQPWKSYFHFHHTQADRIEALDPQQAGRCTAMTAAFIYAVAQLDTTLPKKLVES